MSDAAPHPTAPAGSLPGVDVIGDVHGHLGALAALGRRLGYAVDDGWAHSAGRTLLFVGDLVDRGPHSLETAELVLGLCAAGRAVCLMGNHEYNLVATQLGLAKERPSNAETLLDVRQRPERWAPVLDGLRQLPLAVELPAAHGTPGLRVIHAEWHAGCVDRCRASLAPNSLPDWPSPLMAHVVLASPFGDGALRADLPAEKLQPGGDQPHEILMKGHEELAPEPFNDPDGHERTLERACWWLRRRPDVPADERVVFGHYWCLPPHGDAPVFAPPHPTGHPDNEAWIARHAPDVPGAGERDVPAHERYVCIDYNGMLRHRSVGCVGAYRWPQARVAWAVE